MTTFIEHLYKSLDAVENDIGVAIYCGCNIGYLTTIYDGLVEFEKRIKLLIVENDEFREKYIVILTIIKDKKIKLEVLIKNRTQTNRFDTKDDLINNAPHQTSLFEISNEQQQMLIQVLTQNLFESKTKEKILTMELDVSKKNELKLKNELLILTLSHNKLTQELNVCEKNELTLHNELQTLKLNQEKINQEKLNREKIILESDMLKKKELELINFWDNFKNQMNRAMLSKMLNTCENMPELSNPTTPVRSVHFFDDPSRENINAID